MKNIKPLLSTLGVGMVAAYAFAVLSSRFGPFPGIGHKAPVVGVHK